MTCLRQSDIINHLLYGSADEIDNVLGLLKDEAEPQDSHFISIFLQSAERHSDNYFLGSDYSDTIVRIIDNTSISVVRQYLKSPSENTRIVALRAISFLEAKEAISEVIELLDDENDMVRGEAADALGNIGCPEAIPALIRRLNDCSNFVVIFAAFSLGKIGGSSIGPLKRALRNVRRDTQIDDGVTPLQVKPFIFAALYLLGESYGLHILLNLLDAGYTVPTAKCLDLVASRGNRYVKCLILRYLKKALRITKPERYAAISMLNNSIGFIEEGHGF